MIRTTVRSFISYILLGMFMPALVMAEGTPDGFPPATESVCDTETGAANGLCNAYCEAMDCDSLTPDATTPACQKVFETFKRITGNTTFPCELDCPLTVKDEFNTLVGPPSLIDRCVTYQETGGDITYDAIEVYDDDPVTATNVAGVFLSGSPTGQINQYQIQFVDSDGQIMMKQYQACYDLIYDAAISVVECQPPQQ